MSGDTQASLEARLRDREALVSNQEALVRDAFGEIEDWVAQVGSHRLLLMPPVRRWCYWDRLHQNWNDSGFSAGEALFVPIGKTLGAKRLPQAGATAAGWYVCRLGDQLLGPMPAAELSQRIAAGTVPPEALVWGAEMSQWTRAGVLARDVAAAAAAPPAESASLSSPSPAGTASSGARPSLSREPTAGFSPPASTPAPPAGKRFCPSCGTPLTPGSRFCGGCGSRLQ